MPVNRAAGRAIVVGTAPCRALPRSILEQLGYQVIEADDPYLAMAEICQRPLAYKAAAISLASIYKEEMAFILTVKRRFPQIEMWLAHTDGRAAALAEASRLGADGLVSEEGLHRFAVTQIAPAPVTPMAPPSTPEPARQPEPARTLAPVAATGQGPAEPILSPDELKALLGDTNPGSGEERT